MKQNNENTNAFLIHLSAFTGFLFPFGNIVAPLIAWQTLKDRSLYLDEQGKEAVNFNISYTLYVFIISIAFVPFAFGSIFRNFRNFNNIDININFDNLFGFIGLGSIAGIIYLIGIALVIIASLKAKDGENYKYPFTIKFVK
ncbi:DUF4870 domain-containing protein [Polaribacter cellanae]|uniref:DUF4870 domain-containing protein n=1 Tax=Polaribacter cellanae TaxID=2818493 RepID=A0A975CQD4_9FLAO|nr:DUF4870 domain-containing protein [Polaribacter cellanae]QTE22790.1 DUF4870 domain-containing protein [Polaribacter cellanae]